MSATADAASDVALQYGVLGVVALVFAIAIIYLVRRSEAREKEITAERLAMAEEREGHKLALANVRLEFEQKHRELVQQYAAVAKSDRDDNREHEDAARREFAEIMSTVEDQAAKSAAAVTAVLEKLHSRFVGPRPRRGV